MPVISTTWGYRHVYGIDLDVRAIITPGDNLNLSVSCLKSVWTELIFN